MKGQNATLLPEWVRIFAFGVTFTEMAAKMAFTGIQRGVRAFGAGRLI